MADFNDNFDEASAAVAITAHTPDLGTGWTEKENTTTGNFLQVQGSSAGIVRPNASDGNDRYLYATNPDPTTTDIDVEFTLSGVGADANSDTVGVFARWQDNSNYYIFFKRRNASTTDTQIYKVSGGLATLLTETNDSTTANDVYKFELRGSTLKAYRDSGGGFVEVLSTTDTDVSSAGAAGLVLGNAAVAADDIDVAFEISNFNWTGVAAGSTAVLTGVSATGSVGTITTQASSTATLTGVSGTGAVGSITPLSVADGTAIFSGVPASGSVGDISPVSTSTETAVLSGVFATGSVGTVSIQNDSVVLFSGVSATGVVGTMSSTATDSSGWGQIARASGVWSETTQATGVWTEL